MASRKRKRGEERNLYREDSITILNAVVAFKRRNHGATPTRSTMKPVYDSIKDSLHRRYGIDQLSSRILGLRSSYRSSILSGKVPVTPFDRAFFELSRKAWGPMEPVRDRNKNVDGKKLEILGEQMGMYWEREKLGVGILEVGIRFVDKLKAEELERKWRRLLREELEITTKSFELKSEICEALDDDMGKDEANFLAAEITGDVFCTSVSPLQVHIQKQLPIS